MKQQPEILRSNPASNREVPEEPRDIQTIRAATKREVEELMRNHASSLPPSWMEILKLFKTKRTATEFEIHDTYRKKATQADPNLQGLKTRMNLALAGHDIAIEVTPDRSGTASQNEWALIHNLVQITPKVPTWLKQFHDGLRYMAKKTQSPVWKALLQALAGKYEGVPAETLEELPEIQSYSAGLRGLISNINIWGLQDTDAQIHMRNGIVIIGAKDEIPVVRKVSNDPERELHVLRTQRTAKHAEAQVATLLAVEYSERLKRAQRILAKMEGKTTIEQKEPKPKKIKEEKEETDSPTLPQNQIERLRTATRKEALEALKKTEWDPTEKAILGTLPETRQVREESVDKINKSREEPIPLTMLRTLINLRLAQFGLQLEVDPDPSGDRSNNTWNLQVANTTILYEEDERIHQLHEHAATVTSKIRSKTVRALLAKLLHQYGGVPVAELEKEPAFKKYGGGLRMLITNANNQNLAQFGLEIKKRNGIAIIGGRHEGIMAVAPQSEKVEDDITRQRAALAYATQELKAVAALAADYCGKMLDTENTIEELRPRALKPAPKPRKQRFQQHVKRKAQNGTEQPRFPTPASDMDATEKEVDDDVYRGSGTAETEEPEGLNGQNFIQRDQLRRAVENEVKRILREKQTLSESDLTIISDKLAAIKLPWNLENMRTAFTRTILTVISKASQGTIPPAAISKLFSVMV